MVGASLPPAGAGRGPIQGRRATIGSAIWFVVAPVLVAGVVPWSLTGWEADRSWLPLQIVGSLLIATGTAGLLSAFAGFVMEGKGTPAPVAPPTRLVIGGLYRFVRNPMYLAVILVVVGQALILGRVELCLYAGAAWLVTVALVRWIEEPILRTRFGADYDMYQRAVPAWVPRRPR
jgi:protein-S-isoprenylcysteine O-methyltransferase Ste14